MGIRTDLALEAREIFEENRRSLARAEAGEGGPESGGGGQVDGDGGEEKGPGEIPGVDMDVEQWDENVKVTRIRILTEEGAGLLGKPPGTYVTIEVQGAVNGTEACKAEAARAVAAELKRMLPEARDGKRRRDAGSPPYGEATGKSGSGQRDAGILPYGEATGKPGSGQRDAGSPPYGETTGRSGSGRRDAATSGVGAADGGKALTALVIGLGNRQVTPDALGPRAAGQVRVTRHVFELFADQVEEGTSCVSALWPGVMSSTGMETAELIRKAVELVEPDVIIAVDALAAREASRISTTIQISDTGISPGAGTGNMRKELKEETIGRKVLALGVPTVIDSETLILDSLGGFLTEPEKAAAYLEERGASLLVTSSDIDEVIQSFSEIIANAINITLHPGIYS